MIWAFQKFFFQIKQMVFTKYLLVIEKHIYEVWSKSTGILFVIKIKMMLHIT